MACGFAQQFWQLLIAARMTVAVGEAGGMAPSISMVSGHVSSAAAVAGDWPVHDGPALRRADRAGCRRLDRAAPRLARGVPVVRRARRRARAAGVAARARARARRIRWPAEPPSAAAAATESLSAQLRRLLADPAFRHICWGCGMAGVAGYGYAIWTPSFLMRTHGLTLAHAGLLFGVASGLGAVAGSIFSGWACDRLVRRDLRWQLGLPLVGVAIAVPMAFALFLWPAGPAWTLGTLKVPPRRCSSLGFGFFASWWPSLSYSAVSQMVPASEARGGGSAESVHHALRCRRRAAGHRDAVRSVDAALRQRCLALGAVLRVGADGADGGGVCSGAGALSVPHGFANRARSPDRLRWTVGSFRTGSPRRQHAARAEFECHLHAPMGNSPTLGREPSGRGIRPCIRTWLRRWRPRRGGQPARPRGSTPGRRRRRRPVCPADAASGHSRRDAAPASRRWRRGHPGAAHHSRPGLRRRRPRRSPPSRARRPSGRTVAAPAQSRARPGVARSDSCRGRPGAWWSRPSCLRPASTPSPAAGRWRRIR